MVDDPDPGHRFSAEITLVEALGSELMVHFELDAAPVDAGDPDAVEEIGEHANGVGRFSPRSRVRAGETTEIVLDVANLHFFDPESRGADLDLTGCARHIPSSYRGWLG